MALAKGAAGGRLTGVIGQPDGLNHNHAFLSSHLGAGVFASARVLGIACAEPPVMFGTTIEIFARPPQIAVTATPAAATTRGRHGPQVLRCCDPAKPILSESGVGLPTYADVRWHRAADDD